MSKKTGSLQISAKTRIPHVNKGFQRIFKNEVSKSSGEGNCTASDTMNVKILKLITVPNSFSPNGDGINDQWVITNLAEYPGNRVEVYNRYGQIIFQSKGYGQSWDGTYKGSPLPFATYYYIITLNNGFAPVTGSVTIVR